MADGPSLQVPYFATPERRLGTIPDLIVAQRGGTPTPMTLPGQQLPTWDLGTKIKTGIEAGQLALKNKMVAAQSEAQAQMAKNAQMQIKFYNDYIKMTNSRTDINDSQKAGLIDAYGYIHGFQYGPTGGQVQPGAYSAPIISELQKRYMSGNMTVDDYNKALQNLYPSFLYPPPSNAPILNKQPPNRQPSTPVIKAPIKTTTNGTNGTGDNDQSSAGSDGVQGFSGTIGQ